MTVNGTVQWDKGMRSLTGRWGVVRRDEIASASVTFYMPGRHRQQCRTRYQRTLDENVRHGRWSDHEDLVSDFLFGRFFSCGQHH